MPRRNSIDINCDVGEIAGEPGFAKDIEISKWVSSMNIACGFYAGSADRISAIAKSIHIGNVSLGAHPGYADRQNFGRVSVDLSDAELQHLVAYQISICQALLERAGRTLGHIKLHGALYHLAESDNHTRELIADVIQSVAPNKRVLVSATGCLQFALDRRGMVFQREAFPDRAYLPSGQLVPRNQPGAVIQDSEEVARRAVQLVQHKQIEAIDGAMIPIECESICLHGDHPHAGLTARLVFEALRDAKILVAVS